MHAYDEKLKAFGRLLNIMDTLREKCPWDAKQTNESLRTHTVEEVFELCEAIINNDDENIAKELGDILLHVVFYSKIGEEKNSFDIADVCNRLCDKLIYRHPHIFQTTKADTAQEVEQNWEQLKLKEKGGNKTVLQGVPLLLPALPKAHRIQDKARHVGFDWDEKEQVWSKIQEELSELQIEIKNNRPQAIEEEFGDLLFSVVNAARLYDIDPENALEKTNQKFIRRFNYIEENVNKQGKSFKDCSMKELDNLWNEAKRKGL